MREKRSRRVEKRDRRKKSEHHSVKNGISAYQARRSHALRRAAASAKKWKDSRRRGPESPSRPSARAQVRGGGAGARRRRAPDVRHRQHPCSSCACPRLGSCSWRRAEQRISHCELVMVSHRPRPRLRTIASASTRLGLEVGSRAPGLTRATASERSRSRATGRAAQDAPDNVI